MNLEFRLNGKLQQLSTAPERRLMEILRKDFGLTGLRPGCNQGQCGSCLVLYNDSVATSCLIPAFRAEAAEIVTIEGFLETDDFTDVEQAFERAGLEPCRFCASAKVLVTHALLHRNSTPSEQEVIQAASGVICRCTSMSRFIDGIHLAADIRRRRTEGSEES